MSQSIVHYGLYEFRMSGCESMDADETEPGWNGVAVTVRSPIVHHTASNMPPVSFGQNTNSWPEVLIAKLPGQRRNNVVPGSGTRRLAAGGKQLQELEATPWWSTLRVAWCHANAAEQRQCSNSTD